ncbi:hypothetical protein [Marinobacter alexandrii]|uniref:hypothetical protein n=1 Tax=Marinobacter alexandrii TaxID=2570351 RepID=UPI00110812EF|nr:hypothetical protein [Marinobacter alexandrii]
MSDTKCNCFSEYLEKVKEKVSPQIPEGADEVSFVWQNRIFLVSGADYSPVNPRVEVEYRKPKKGGGFAKGMTRDTISIMANYCAFCGRKYEKEGDKS